MNFRMILNIIGRVAIALAALLALPMIVAIIYGESCWWAFAITIGITLVIGGAIKLFVKEKNKRFFSREGLVAVSLVWFYVSLVGALPFVINGAIPNYIDALFETVSGFTTTGASILSGDQIESMQKGLLFWRSFTHWIGGMGIVVFVLAFVTGSQDRSMHVLRAEMPGPVIDKLVPRASQTAKILYLIYIGMTFVQFIMLLCGGMPLFDSIVLTFGTAGTGGFGIKADSVASYSNYCQWVIIAFMFLFGINFNVYFLIVARKIKTALSSKETWLYTAIVLVSITAITINIFEVFSYTMSTSDAIRHSAFQVVAYMTTTGYSSIPINSSINMWPNFSRWLLFLLMFIGGCAGSTAGGFKVSRVAMLWCAIKKELRKILHPRNAKVIKFEGKVLTDETLQSVTRYFALYVLIYVVIFIILALDPNPKLDIEANLSAAASCFNNIGPAYGEAAQGFFVYSPVSKIVLTVAMLLGRLEIYPVLLMLSPSTYKQN